MCGVKTLSLCCECFLICLFLALFFLFVSVLCSFLYLSLFINIDHLLSDTLIGNDSDSPDSVCTQNNSHHHTYPPQEPSSSSSRSGADPSLINPTLEPPPLLSSSAPLSSSSSSKSRLSLERSFSTEEEQQKSVECALQPSRVYTISGESAMLASKESLELEVLRGARDVPPSLSQNLGQPSASSSTTSSPTQQHHHHHGGAGGGGAGAGSSHHHGNHHHGNHHGNTGGGGSYLHQHGVGGGSSSSGAGQSQQQHHHHHHHHMSQPLQSSVSAYNIRGWGDTRECGLACDACPGAPSRSQGSLDLESSAREAGKQPRRPLERMCSVDRVTGLDRGERDRARAGERERSSKGTGLAGVKLGCKKKKLGCPFISVNNVQVILLLEMALYY